MGGDKYCLDAKRSILVTRVSFNLQDINLGVYPCLNDSWMDVISSQNSSLLSVDLSGSDITDSGLACLKECRNLEALTCNYCDQISDLGLEQISGNFSLLQDEDSSFIKPFLCSFDISYEKTSLFVRPLVS